MTLSDGNEELHFSDLWVGDLWMLAGQSNMQGIAKLTSAVQANAIAQSVIPQGLQNPPSAEDMLAEIIRPTFKERS